eukprot:CAMPEP_0179008598 /NCGR_PEP_ID=MMETSP0795-20121207/15807_1 /TAXON_ID=88552 /ORGANISM="Amoebophrya sp., Strain Ameob2" /LENGTH=888 /DNA_ID=CAMNT_0020703705 /DNA_START=348 /DNA_END=3015 /DNA_ORIENTATION=-
MAGSSSPSSAPAVSPQLPAYLYRARVVREYQDEEEGEHTLRLLVGEDVFVCETDEESQWWGGFRKQNPAFCGWFPSPYVEKIPDSGPPVAADEVVEHAEEKRKSMSTITSSAPTSTAEDEAQHGETTTTSTSGTATSTSTSTSATASLAAESTSSSTSASHQEHSTSLQGSESQKSISQEAAAEEPPSSAYSSSTSAEEGGSKIKNKAGGGPQPRPSSKTYPTSGSSPVSTEVGESISEAEPASASIATTRTATASGERGSPVDQAKNSTAGARNSAKVPKLDMQRVSTSTGGSGSGSVATASTSSRGGAAGPNAKANNSNSSSSSSSTSGFQPAKRTSITSLSSLLERDRQVLQAGVGNLCDIAKPQPVPNPNDEPVLINSTKHNNNIHSARGRRVDVAFNDYFEQNDERKEQQEQFDRSRREQETKSLRDEVEKLRRDLAEKEKKIGALQTETDGQKREMQKRRANVFRYMEERLSSVPAGVLGGGAAVEAAGHSSGSVRFTAKQVQDIEQGKSSGTADREKSAATSADKRWDKSKTEGEEPREKKEESSAGACSPEKKTSEERAGTFGLRAELSSLKSELESLRERLEEAGTQKRRLETDVAKKDNEKKYLNHLLDESYRLWKTDNSERGKWVQKYFDRYVELESMLISADTEEGKRRIQAIRPILMEKRNKRALARDRKRTTTQGHHCSGAGQPTSSSSTHLAPPSSRKGTTRAEAVHYPTSLREDPPLSARTQIPGGGGGGRATPSTNLCDTSFLFQTPRVTSECKSFLEQTPQGGAGVGAAGESLRFGSCGDAAVGNEEIAAPTAQAGGVPTPTCRINAIAAADHSQHGGHQKYLGGSVSLTNNLVSSGPGGAKIMGGPASLSVGHSGTTTDRRISARWRKS